MAKQIEWSEFPLIGATYSVPVSEADIELLVSLEPDCDPRNPPWKKIKAELLAAGHDQDSLGCPRYRRLLLMLKECRAASVDEWEGPDNPSQFAKQLGISLPTFTRWVKNGKLRVKKITTKKIMVNRADLLRCKKK